jgi:HD-GYP domain-containing protein (c-di-GMP phosphodiesterase class II)
MTNDRPYRKGRPASEAIEELVRCSGQQFSPRVVEAMVRLFDADAIPEPAQPNGPLKHIEIAA